MRLRTSAALICALFLSDIHLAAADRSDREVEAARKLFERNLEAIRRRDRDAYLATYLDSETLVRTSPEGFQLGFASHAAQTTETGWPDLFEAQDLRLTPVRPGLVYGTYRYRVRDGSEEHSGISERLFVKTPAGWRIALTTAFDSPRGTPPPPRALVGATLVDGTGSSPIPDSVVLIRGGKIECAGESAQCTIPEGVSTLDVTGTWITPGLVDAHVHFSQTGWADGRPDALDLREKYPYEQVQADLKARPERWFRSYLCSGVTAVFDVGGYPWTWGLRARAEDDSAAPHVEAAGPLLSTRDHWLTLPGERQFLHLSDEKAARTGAKYLASQHTSAIKVWFIVSADSNFDQMASAVTAAGEEARRLDVPLIVHATGLREAKAALKAGARLLVHSVWDQAVDDEFLQLALDNKTIYCPTLTVRSGYNRMFAAALSGVEPKVDDPQGCADQQIRDRVAETARAGAGQMTQQDLDRRLASEKEARAVMYDNLKRVHRAGIPVAMGTDAGNPLTLHGPSVYAEMEAMQEAGLSAMEVLVASTRGGAMAMGRDNDLGTVEPGKIADLLVVEADPTTTIANLRKPRYVVRAGVLRGIEELRAVPGAAR